MYKDLCFQCYSMSEKNKQTKKIYSAIFKTMLNNSLCWDLFQLADGMIQRWKCSSTMFRGGKPYKVDFLLLSYMLLWKNPGMPWNLENFIQILNVRWLVQEFCRCIYLVVLLLSLSLASFSLGGRWMKVQLYLKGI